MGAVPGGATNFEVTDTCMVYPHFTPLFLGSVSEKLIAAWSKGGRGLARPLQKVSAWWGCSAPCEPLSVCGHWKTKHSLGNRYFCVILIFHTHGNTTRLPHCGTSSVSERQLHRSSSPAGRGSNHTVPVHSFFTRLASQRRLPHCGTLALRRRQPLPHSIPPSRVRPGSTQGNHCLLLFHRHHHTASVLPQ